MDVDEDAEERLVAVCAASRRAWLRLQELVWGPRWDFTGPGLDFTVASLGVLAAWLRRAVAEQPPERFGVVLRSAGHYFGEMVQHHVQACWEVRPDGLIGVRVYEGDDGADRHIDMVAVLGVWCEAIARGDESDRTVWIDQWHEATRGGLPVAR